MKESNVSFISLNDVEAKAVIAVNLSDWREKGGKDLTNKVVFDTLFHALENHPSESISLVTLILRTIEGYMITHPEYCELNIPVALTQVRDIVCLSLHNQLIEDHE